MEAFYADQNELPSGLSPKISNFTIGPFQVSDAEKVKIKVKVQLNLHGIVMIESATLIEGCRCNSSAKIKAHSTSEHTGGDNHVSSDVANDASDSYNVDSNLSTKETADDMREGKIWRKDIPVSETVHGGMTRAKLSQAQEKELQLTQQDIKMEQTQEKKNLLESYVYETRTKVVVECSKADQWLLEKNQQQESMPKNADPVLWSSEINKKADTLEAMCKHIMNSKASATEPDEILDDRNEEDDKLGYL